MRKAAAALLCLLCRAMPLASSELVFERTYDLPRPLGGEETVVVRLTTTNDPAVVQPEPATPTRIRVCTTASTSLKISKIEESGGYAHGIDWWVNGVEQDRLLYAFARNGAASLGTYPSGTTIEIQLYRVNVIIHEGISPRFRVTTLRDTTGPAIGLSPPPAAYPGVTVTATVSDAGVGMAPGQPGAPAWQVARAATGEIVASGRGTTIALVEEGCWLVSFRAADLLGNDGSSPSGTAPANEYVIDTTAPVLTGVTPSLVPRLDGDLDVDLAFAVADAGVGVALDSLRVAVTCSVDGVVRWTRELDSGALVAVPLAGGANVRVPALAAPRSSTLAVEIAASDAIGNAMAAGTGRFVYPLPPPPLHASVRSGEVTAEAVPSGSRLVARYQAPLVLDRPRSALPSDGVARYRITRILSGAVETVLDLPPAAFADRFSDRDGRAAWVDTMEGARYAHGSVSYRVETVFAVPGSESAAADGVAVMPNIEAWQVCLAADGNLLTALDSRGAAVPELWVSDLAGVIAWIGPDPEGDALAMRLEAAGPGGITASWPPAGGASSIAFADVFPGAPDGSYQVRFVVEEAGNPRPMASPWCTIVVDPNAGWIEGDVTWTADQVRPGSTVVRPGAKLTVARDVRISFARAIDPATGSALAITVRSGGTLVLSPGSVVQPVGWRPGTPPGDAWDYWAGIAAEGAVSVDGASINGAMRGIACLPGSDVAVVGARIESCRTGIHAVGAGVEPRIDASWFVACARYAIKEDAGAAPVVTRCVFDRNTCDYYDSVLTVVAAAEIDGLAPHRNHDNRSAGASP